MERILLTSSLLGRVWQKEVVPAEWKIGKLFKLFKKGNRRDYGNASRIMLLSVSGKILCRIVLEKLKTAVGRKKETARLASVEKDPVFIIFYRIAASRIVVEQYVE